jgi:hypothetical protein
MSDPRVTIALGIAVAAFGVAQLGGASLGENVALAVLPGVLGVVLVTHGLREARL